MNSVAEPRDPYKKQRERARKLRGLELSPFDTMLESRPADEYIAGEQKYLPERLFLDLWHEGEVAVLFGDKGSGKSVLAVQIAEALSWPFLPGLLTGEDDEEEDAGYEKADDGPGTDYVPDEGIVNDLESLRKQRITMELEARRMRSRPRTRRVLYIDFERTAGHFAKRYSGACERSRGGYGRFHFIRTQLAWDGDIPPAFKGDVDAFLRHSILRAIEDARAEVVIIDSAAYLGRSATTGTGSLRAIKTLKYWAAKLNISILVLAQSSARYKTGVPLTIASLGSRNLAQMADSVFAIGRSTAAEDLRYVKHLASLHSITHDASNVLTYRLTSGTPGNAGSPACTAAAGVISTKFLALNYLGPSAESDHLRDYAAEALAAERAHQLGLKRLRQSSSSTITNGILDGSYKRYLLGE